MTKKTKNKILIISIIITLLTPTYQAKIHAAQSYPYIFAKSGLALEAHTGTILYEKNMNEQIYPASTTKMLTALIVNDKLDLNSQITVPENFPKIGGTSINIIPGETFTVEQLLNATLLRSANDAATMLAIATAGSIEDFAALMNYTAQTLGCTNTNFVNPSGLHDPNHYTTALDMSKIAIAFLKDPKLMEIVKKTDYTIPSTSKKPERYIQTTNRLIIGDRYQGENYQIENNQSNIPVKYDIVDGIKTGTTPEAGNCLVSTAPKDNLRIIALVFGSTENHIYSDSRYLLDYGLDNYKRTQIIEEGATIKTLKKPFSEPQSVDLKIQEGYSYVEPITQNSNIIGQENINKIKMPLKKGQQVGTYTIKNQDTKETIIELPIYAQSDYESKLSWNYMGKSSFGRIFRIIILITLILIALSTIIYTIRQQNIKKRRKQRRLKRQQEEQKANKKNIY